MSLDSISIIVPSPSNLGSLSPRTRMQGYEYRLIAMKDQKALDLDPISVTLAIIPNSCTSLSKRDTINVTIALCQSHSVNDEEAPKCWSFK